MHRGTGMQANGRVLKVAVLDTIHGGRAIAAKMVESGLKAQALEVYHHTPDLAGYDLVACPVHLSPNNPALAQARREKKKIITHHQAVGELLSGQISGPSAPLIFEVTGTHSKTTTALLLSLILSGKMKVLSHTTRGLEIWQDGQPRLMRSGLSITPASIIDALALAEAESVRAIVCEVSLGGTGLADYGIITSLSTDYLIAGKTKWASTAKLQMLSLAKRGAKILCNADARLSPDVTFAFGGMVSARSGELDFAGRTVLLHTDESLHFSSYETAIAAAAAAAMAAGLAGEEIAQALYGFAGFSGRMKTLRKEGRTIFDCSNSGLKVKDVEDALDLASGDDLTLIAGEDAETVCEGMNIPALSGLLRERRGQASRLILVGERLRPLAEELSADWARNLDEGLAKAEKDSPKRLLSCVKCFR